MVTPPPLLHTHITRALPWNRDLYVEALLSGAYCFSGEARQPQAHSSDNAWYLLHSPYISRHGLSSQGLMLVQEP